MARNRQILFAIISLILAPCAAVYAQSAQSAQPAKAIQWRTDFAAATRESVEKNRPIFLDVYMDPCLNCTKLDTITYADPAFVNLINGRFIPVKIDGQINVVEVQGQRVNRFPALYFMGVDGSVLAQHEGFTDAGSLQQVAQLALGKLAPRRDVVAFQAEAKVGPNARNREQIWKGPRNYWLTSNFSAPPFNAQEERILRAREILVQAVDCYRRQQWLTCLEQTRILIVYYPDLPESVDARQLASAINTDVLEKLGKDLTENLSQVYWELAQQKLRAGQTSQASSTWNG